MLFRERFAVDFDVWVNKIVEWFSSLARDEVQVAACRECDSVFGEIAEVVIFHFRVLVGFGDVGRNPVVLVGVEEGPAVVASDGSFSVSFGNWKTDFKASRQSFCTSQRNKQAVEVGAVSELAVAGPDGISVAVTWSRLVVLHVRVDSLVEKLSEAELVSRSVNPFEQIEWPAGCGNQAVRLQKQTTL